MDRIRRKIEKIKKNLCLPSLVIFFTGQIIHKKAKQRKMDRKAKNLAIKKWKSLKSDKGAFFDKTVSIDASKIERELGWAPEETFIILLFFSCLSSSIRRLVSKK